MDRYDRTGKIALMGIAANLALLAIKLAAGFSSRSQAMIADGFNSAGDVFASAMTYAGNRIASKPEDKSHPYGHGKAEYIFSMIISFSLLLVAYSIFRSSLESILSKREFTVSWWLIATAVATILLKLYLFTQTRRSGLREENLLVLANSEDHRNDILVTFSTLVGIIAGARGIYWLDGVVGLGISLWIAYTGLRIFRVAYTVLMDTNMDGGLKEEIEKIIRATDGVDHIDDIIAKPIGVSFIIIVKVSVWGEMTVNESHSIAARIRKQVRSLKSVKDVVVHINPV